MISREDIQFILPAFNLKEHRYKNFAFVVNAINQLGCKIFVTEQTRTPTLAKHSSLWHAIKGKKNIKYVNFVSDKEDIHKTALINWTVRNYINTEYFWVNDADCFLKFQSVFDFLKDDFDFIKPYSIAKKLNEDETNIILNGGSIIVDYTDEKREYISLFGALSFLCKKTTFNKIGCFDEDLIGAGHEDFELFKRIEFKKIKIKEIELKGIHLYHPVNIERYNKTIKEHNEIIQKKCNYIFDKKTKEVHNTQTLNYNFTVDRVSMYEKSWIKFLSHFKGKKINGLELGSFEGRASIWFLENILSDSKSTLTCVDKWLSDTNRVPAVERRFTHNTLIKDHFNKIIKLKGDNAFILPDLIGKKTGFYDFIYLNSDCKCFYILRDLCYCHSLLKDDGILIVNNYSSKVTHKIKTPTTTKAAIDSFIESYSNFYEILHTDYQLVMKKTNKPLQVFETQQKNMSSISRAVYSPYQIDSQQTPKIKLSSENRELKSGEFFKIDCYVEQDVKEKLLYQWYKNNIALESEINSTLHLGFVDKSDSGLYKVEVTNSYGSALSDLIEIKINNV